MVDVSKQHPPIVLNPKYPFKFSEWSTNHLAFWMERKWGTQERLDGIRIYQIRNGIQVIEELPSPLHPDARVYHVRDALRRQPHAISCKLMPGEVFPYAEAIFEGALFADLNQKYNPSVPTPSDTTGYGDW